MVGTGEGVEQSALWINIATFAVSAVCWMLVCVAQARKTFPWMRTYLVYHGAYALWLLVLTFSFFRLTYLPATLPVLDIIVGTIRLAISIVIVWSLPGLLARVGRKPVSSAVRRIRPAATVVLVVPSALGVWFDLDVIPLGLLNIVFNAYLLASSGLLAATLLRQPRGTTVRSLLAFAWISVLFYTYAVAAGIALVALGVSSPTLSTISASLYVLPWSLGVGLAFYRRLIAPPPAGVSPDLASSYALTRREREIVDHVLSGKPNKEIAAACNIALRTVETHLYNIFRKCGVRSRAELIALLKAPTPHLRETT